MVGVFLWARYPCKGPKASPLRDPTLCGPPESAPRHIFSQSLKRHRTPTVEPGRKTHFNSLKTNPSASVGFDCFNLTLPTGPKYFLEASCLSLVSGQNPLWEAFRWVQGYLAHKKPHVPPGYQLHLFFTITEKSGRKRNLHCNTSSWGRTCAIDFRD